MIREYTTQDKELAAEYLEKAPFGQAIQAVLNAYEVTDRCMTAYMDTAEDGSCEGFYVFLHRNLLLYCENNKVEVDFLEQMFGIQEPYFLAGPRNNVLVASWLLTDYDMADGQPAPELKDEQGNPVKCAGEILACEGEWATLEAHR